VKNWHYPKRVYVAENEGNWLLRSTVLVDSCCVWPSEMRVRRANWVAHKRWTSKAKAVPKAEKDFSPQATVESQFFLR
jgi:hypothetical protein